MADFRRLLKVLLLRWCGATDIERYIEGERETSLYIYLSIYRYKTVAGAKTPRDSWKKCATILLRF